MHKALYRKWRPCTFDDVVGQDHITRVLKNEVCEKLISHAYLFTGPRGTGKTSCAKIFANAINCSSPINGNPCGECEFCKSADSESSLDIIEIDAASNNGVENIRSIRDEMAFTPTKCKYRVYIVDEVHMLSMGAFNAFLKTLEEPPPYVVFILATTEIHKLPLTIISRCQKFEFSRFSQAEICAQLEKVCINEKISAEKNALLLISNLADGAMRDALSILEQCRNACENSAIDEESVRSVLGMPEKNLIHQIVVTMFNSKFSDAISMIDQMHKRSMDFGKVCDELTEYFRKLMIYKATNSDNYLPDKDFKPEGIKFSFTLDCIIDCISLLQQTHKNIIMGNNKKTEMEIAVIKICSKFSGHKNLDYSPLKTDNDSSTKKTTSCLDSITKQVSNPKSTDNTLDEPTILAQWDKIMDKIKGNAELTSLGFSLQGSKAYKKGNYILISPKNSLAFELLKKPEYRNELKKVIFEVLGKHFSLGPYEPTTPISDSSAQEPIPPEKNPLQELIKSAKSSNINVIIK